MTDTTGEIIVGIDGSERALDAVRWAVAVAAPRNRALRLLSGYDPVSGVYGAGLPFPPDAFDAIEQAAQEDLDQAVQVAREAAPGVAVRTERVRIPPIPALIDESKNAHLIVLGASGRGGYTGMLTGSTAVAVVAHAACPVVVVRRPEDPAGPVVAGVDGSPASMRALAAAFDEASWRGVPLVALHSWRDADYVTATPVQSAVVESTPTDEEQARVLAESLAGWQEKYPDVAVERVVLKDRPRHCLLEWSAKAQLVVVGSRGRGGFQGLLLGSTSQALMHHARCPVLVVRP